MKKIAIFGAPCNNTNLGCMALTYSLIHLLEEVSAEIEEEFSYVVFEGAPDRNSTKIVEDELNLNYGKICSYPLFYCKDLLRTITFAHHNMKLLAKLKECSIAIDMTQGDSFADIYGNERFNISTNIKRLVEASGVPLILGPQTYGPFLNHENKRKAGRAIRYAKLVMARDAISCETVYNLSGRKAIVTTDLAFQLPWTPHDRKAGSKKVGVNISALLVKDKAESTGTNFVLKTEYDSFIYELLNWLCKENYDVHLISHVAEDYIPAQQFHKAFPQTHLVDTFMNPMEAKSFISGMNVFIGSRMHATIAAVSCGVVTIPLAYSMKFQGVFELIEYRNVVDLQKLSTIQALEKTKSLVLNRTKLENDVEYSMRVCKKYKSITKNQLKFAILDMQNKRK